MPEKKDFIIKDKRIFAEEEKDKQEKDEKKEPSREEAKDQASEEMASQEEAEKDYQLPEINFSTFIISLNASALTQFGMIEDPASGKKIKNLAIAKQTIDILGMLEEKTRGNLTDDEENILKNILYDLRMTYIKEK